MHNKLNYKKYAEYKDSGVEWLGEIPKHWEVSRLGVLLNPISLNNRLDLPLLSITRENGVILRDLDNEEENHNFIPDDLSNYKVIKTGQFGMNKMKAWQGSYGISDYDGIVSPAYFIFDLNKNIFPKYFHTAIRSKLYISYFGSASDGVRIGQWDLSKERMKQIPFLIPPLSEQTAIAAYLDDKTAKIDKAILYKENMIKLLKERQQILIHKAITKGLNPDVKMKDSGVDWIGEIPESWEVKRFKYLLDEYNVRSTNGNESLLSLSKYHGVVPKSSLEERAGQAESLIGYKKLHPQDLVINKMQAVNGLIAVSKISGITSPDYSIYRAKNKSAINIDYIGMLMLQPVYLAEFKKRVTGVMEGFIRLYTDDLYNVYSLLPPFEEQNEIANWIENTKAKIATAITLKEQEIEKLKEYKSVLINEAVTGKVRVC